MIDNALTDYTDALDYALVGPRDNRVHIVETTRFPFNTICHLARNFGDGYRFGCSGVLVSPHLVLTAAHCIFSRRRGKAPLRIAVCPGRSDQRTFPYGSLVAREFYVPRGFIRPRSALARKQNDYGFVLLPRPFSAIQRLAPVVAPGDRQLRRLRDTGLLGIAGYPGDRPSGTMWYHRERLRRTDRRRLYYTVDTCPGHSGSPIFISPAGNNRDVRIIGVHTSGILDQQGRSYGCGKSTVLAPPNLLNSGVRMSRAMTAVVRKPVKSVFAGSGLVRVGGTPG